MAHIVLDYTRTAGPVRAMHCVNNGPVPARSDQTRGNFDTYKALNIPYARNHDAAFNAEYGGEHSVDICAIFPDFSKDPCDPASYDFVCTDEYVKSTLAAGTKMYYRLGNKIEHYVKKFGTLPPPDFQKWSVICEHIIRHYNEGWADGFAFDLDYWEIWNEPDLDPDDSPNKRCWGGTAAQFYELYVTAARHLKACFPHLKIGGPALAGNTGEWLDGFLARLTRDERVPLDFFSWHIYAVEPQQIMEKAALVRWKLDRAGYTETESILNEWNYVRGWSEDFIYSIRTIIGMKGSAFTGAVMAAAQHSSIDMLMYYDARISAFNGLFDFYTFDPRKGYYPFLYFSRLYALGTEAVSGTDTPQLYTVAATDGVKRAAMITRYSDGNDEAVSLPVTVELPAGRWKVSLVTAEADPAEEVLEAPDGRLTFQLPGYAVLYLESAE